MTRRDYLNLIMLLSALESWGFTTKQALPEQLTNAIEILTKEILA